MTLMRLGARPVDTGSNAAITSDMDSPQVASPSFDRRRASSGSRFSEMEGLVRAVRRLPPSVAQFCRNHAVRPSISLVASASRTCGGRMSERRILWAEMTSPNLRAGADGGIAILPIGSTEQHGRHLPVGTDTCLVSEIARRAAARIVDHRNVVVLPGLWISLAEHHMGFAGTLTLDFRTFVAVLRCTVGSLKRQGFRKVLLLNGHGGNVAALTVIVDELTRDLELPIAAATYWVVAEAAFANILDGQPNLRHACEAETSMMLALDPALTDLKEARGSETPVEGFAEPDGVYRFPANGTLVENRRRRGPVSRRRGQG